MESNETEESVERLPPTPNTLRELYLLSGNRCMFPGCESAMVNSLGDFIGQVCHIKAAKRGGERFNKNQSEEERRHISNLMLMCYAHHVQTNDENTYTVAVLKEYKSVHEARFSDVSGKMEKSMVHDITTQSPVQPPRTLQKFSTVLGWSHTPDELAGDREEFQAFVDRLGKVPKAARDVFRIIIERGDNDGLVPVPELKAVVSISREELATHLAMLDRHRLTTEGDRSDFDQAQVRPWHPRHGWNIAGDLKTFAEKSGIPLVSLIRDGMFGQLD